MQGGVTEQGTIRKAAGIYGVHTWHGPRCMFLPVRKAKERSKAYIVVAFGLGYRAESPRIDAAAEPCPGRFTQHVLVSGVGEVDEEMMDSERVYRMDFSKVYSLLVNKAEKKGRTKQEVDEAARWLTGYSQEELEGMLGSSVT